MTKKLKIKFQLLLKKCHFFSFRSVPGNLFQRVGTALWNDLMPECFFVCSCQIQRRLVCTG